MKNIKIFLLVCLMYPFLFSYGQYDTLLKPGKRWYYKKFDGERYNPREPLEVTNSKIIYNSKSYYFFKNRVGDTVLMREEGRKVYSVLLGNSLLSQKESVMYDFNLQENDTFKFTAFARTHNGGQYEDSTVIETYSVTKTYVENGRKHIELYSKSNMWLRLLWIEGIGCNNSFLFFTYERYDFDPFETNTALVQACDGVSRTFPFDNLPCNENILSIKEPEGKLILFPNPTRNNINISLPSTEIYTVIITDYLGRKVSEYNLEGDLKYQISTNYPKGFYWVKTIKNGSTHHKSILIIE